MKPYTFKVTVTGADREDEARVAVLTAFAKREADGCRFKLKRLRNPRLSAATESK